MKKRIIAALLLVVMTVLALASCGFDLAEDDVTEYTDGNFDVNKFVAALKNIEIEDGEYTTDKATQDLVIAGDLYEAIASGVITNIGTTGKVDGALGKLTDGTIGASDVVYFCYYISYTFTDDNGKTVTHEYDRSEMDLSKVSSSTSAIASKHVVRLGSYINDDAFKTALVNALKGKTLVPYSMNASKVDVKNTDVIAISYDLLTPGSDGTTVTEKVNYQFVNLADTENALAVKLASYFDAEGKLKPGTVFKVGEDKIAFPVDDYNAETNASTTYEITVDGKTYKNIKVNYVVDSLGTEIVVPRTLETDTDLDALTIDNSDGSAATTITTFKKDMKVNYHIYPVYRVEVPETNADSVIQYVYGSKLSSLLTTAAAASGISKEIITELNEILNDEGYKYTEGETTKTAKELTAAIAKIWKSDFADNAELKALSDKVTEANEKVDAAIKAKENAPAAEKDAKEKDIQDAEAALDVAKKELEAAKKAAIEADIKKLTAAKKDTTVLGTKLMEVLDKELRDSRKEAYDKYITAEIKKAVYKLIDEMVVVTSYPEDLEKEFYEHIYDSYEYKFYNGNFTPEGANTATQSNYLQYGGDLTAYLKAQTKATDEEGIEKAIMAEAHGYIKPLIKIYVVAQALDNYDFGGGKSADDLLTEFVRKDIEAKLYDSYYFYDDKKTTEENEEIKEKYEESADSSKETALETAEHFLIDDEGFKVYKKQLGRKDYRYQEQNYGETNLRAARQTNNLFDLILSTDRTVVIDEEAKTAKAEITYKAGADGKLYHSYRFIQYKVK